MEGGMFTLFRDIIVDGGSVLNFLGLFGSCSTIGLKGSYVLLKLTDLGRFLGAKGALDSVLATYSATNIRNSRYGLDAQLAS